MTKALPRCAALAVALLLLCLPGRAQSPPESDTSENELRVGDSALATHDFPSALHAYMTASRLGGNNCVKCYLKISLTCLAMKNWRDTILLADRALSVATADTDKAQAHNLKGTAFLAQAPLDANEYPLAEQEYRAATLGDPSAPAYHFSLGVTLLKQSHDAEGVSELRRFLELAPGDPKTAFVNQWIADPRRARGQYVPDFHFTSAQGQEYSLNSLKGKIVVLDFWATWCKPCRYALPDIRELAGKYPPDRFVLISVSLDEDPSAWHDFIEKEKMTWPQVHDGGSDLFRAFELQDVPTYVVLAADGSLVDRVIGTDPDHGIGERLKDILSKRPELNPH